MQSPKSALSLHLLLLFLILHLNAGWRDAIESLGHCRKGGL